MDHFIRLIELCQSPMIALFEWAARATVEYDDVILGLLIMEMTSDQYYECLERYEEHLPNGDWRSLGSKGRKEDEYIIRGMRRSLCWMMENIKSDIQHSDSGKYAYFR